jgi:LysM repeat protein
MPRKSIWCLLLALTLILVVTPTGTQKAHAQAGMPAEIFRLVNQVRAGYGLAPFVWDNSLAIAAQNQANYMATNNIYSHTGAGGSSPASRAIAAGYPGHATENIVGGTDLTPSQGVVWWQNSASHFNTMISQQYIHAGVGFAQGHDQNFYALVVGVPADQSPDPILRREPTGEVFAPVAPIQLAAARDDGSIVHVVGPGHSFWAIAARYEIPLDQLYLYNNLNENSVINPGDELIIRLADGQLPPPTPTPPASYIVQEGDSLWTIAAWYKLSLADLLWLNSMEEDSLLSPGDEVRIRLLPGETPPPTPTPNITYTVQTGDTAWGIALEYGLTLDELLNFNNMNANTILSIGDTLLIVAPSPIPTETPIPTATILPSATTISTNTPLPQPTTAIADSLIIERAAATTIPVPNISDGAASNSLPITALILIGFALIGAGAIAITFLRQSR